MHADDFEAKSHRLWVLALLLAVFAVYAPSLANGFTLDGLYLAKSIQKSGEPNPMEYCVLLSGVSLRVLQFTQENRHEYPWLLMKEAEESHPDQEQPGQHDSHSQQVDAESPLRRARSEERRVGQECRSRWSPAH